MLWHSWDAACVLVLLYVNRQRRNRIRKGWNIIKVWTKPHISRNLTGIAYNTLIQELLLLVFCVVILCRRNIPQIWTTLNFIDELKSCRFVFTSICHLWSVKQITCFDWLTLINTHLPTIHMSNMSLPTQKSWCKSRENRDKFYLLPTVCQHVCRLFLRCCQHEFANVSLLCEGGFKLRVWFKFSTTEDLHQTLRCPLKCYGTVC